MKNLKIVMFLTTVDYLINGMVDVLKKKINSKHQNFLSPFAYVKNK